MCDVMAVWMAVELQTLYVLTRMGYPDQSGWGWTAVCCSHWLIFVLQVSSCHAAKQVLEHFWNRFIANMDAKTVVMELLNMGVIDEGIKNRIFREDSPKLQNVILHNCLKNMCTDVTLRAVCDVIIGVRGNPRMRALGEDIKKRLVAGIYCKWCARLHTCVHACACVCTVAGPVSAMVRFIEGLNDS